MPGLNFKSLNFAVALVSASVMSSLAYADTVMVAPVNTATVIEQHSDGSATTITKTPTGISMRDGMPFFATKIITTPTNTVTVAPTVVPVAPSDLKPVSTPLRNTVTTPVVAAPTTVVNAATGLTAYQLNPVLTNPKVVSSHTEIKKVLKDAVGNEFLVPARTINPGDVIQYQITYTNTTATPVSDVMATVNLPNGVKLVSVQAPIDTLATTSGDSYQVIEGLNNGTVMTPYSGLRWNWVNLPANGTQTVTIRTQAQ